MDVELTRLLILGFHYHYDEEDDHMVQHAVTVDSEDGSVNMRIEKEQMGAPFIPLPQPSFEVWTKYPDGELCYVGQEIAGMNPLPDWQAIAKERLEEKAKAATGNRF
jgi:hypothetical protein